MNEDNLRRYIGNMNSERYCGNINTRGVHDLNNEEKLCQIDDIIKAGNDKPFNSLFDAHFNGFKNNCKWCIGV